MKKILAFALAVVMIFALGVSAFADHASAPIEGSNHSYKAYQIFSGSQAEGSDEIGSVEWADGIDSVKFLAALQEEFAEFADCTTAAQVAKAMENWADKSDNARAFAKLAEDYVVAGKGIAVEAGETELDAGYYLVVDETASVAADDAYNVALLQLTQKGTFDIEAKNEVPEVIKKIVEDEKRVDSNNAAIGDVVNYEIKSAVPASAADYEYYFFIINDTLSKGLTFNKDIVVTIGDKEATNNVDYSVKVTNNEDGTTNFQVALADAIKNAGKEVVVTYTATVNNKAVVGVEGNPNEVDLKFSNNPNKDYDGTPFDNDHKGFPKDESNGPEGVTPKDYTITYTTQLKVFKVDQDKQPLNGAEFTLTGETLNKVLVYKEQFTAAQDGTYYLLNNGTYTTEEPKADTFRAATAADGRDGGYVKSGNNYVEATEEQLADSSIQLYILVEGTEAQYANDGKMYKMEKVFVEQAADSKTESVVATVDANGEVTFTGLSAGEYTLSETKVPDGYNPVADIEFEIVWTAPAKVESGDEDCGWNVSADSAEGVKYVAADDAFEVTVINQKGGTLPETGGIGTTIFYAIGGMMVVAAALLLITKKRMGTEA